MRGTPERATYFPKFSGITPACAGNTLAGLNKMIAITDHPRMCGEHLLESQAFAILVGSPPHVRGTRLCECNRLCRIGITPACAGNTLRLRSPDDPDWDHPRMCGEHRSKIKSVNPPAGSPPHVRGTPVAHFLLPSSNRITPACAGNTAIWS